MAFLDAAEQGDQGGGGGPPTPAPGGGGGGANPMQGGGPVLAALANRQRGPAVSAPGMGNQASSLTMVMQAIGMLQQALPGLQVNTPVQQDVLRALQRLSKHVPQGQPAVGVQQTQLQDMLKSVLKNALLSRLMGQQGGQPGGSPDQPAGQSPLPGAMAQAPMPSTPLPGA